MQYVGIEYHMDANIFLLVILQFEFHLKQHAWNSQAVVYIVAAHLLIGFVIPGWGLLKLHSLISL